MKCYYKNDDEPERYNLYVKKVNTKLKKKLYSVISLSIYGAPHFIETDEEVEPVEVQLEKLLKKRKAKKE